MRKYTLGIPLDVKVELVFVFYTYSDQLQITNTVFYLSPNQTNNNLFLT